jgi:CheY-like chemotaxis protein
MTEPLAFILYENLLPGSQLSNRLQDLGYRVQSILDPAELLQQVEKERPLLAVVDLVSNRRDICALITELRQNAVTRHLPVLAFTGAANAELQSAAWRAGATLVASNEAILTQFPRLLEQVLEVD